MVHPRPMQPASVGQEEKNIFTLGPCSARLAAPGGRGEGGADGC